MRCLALKFESKKIFFSIGISEQHLIMLKELISKLFSGKCRLKYLELDLSKIYVDGEIDQYLKPISTGCSNGYQNNDDNYCLMLRRLKIRVRKGSCIAKFLDRIPNVEQLSVEFVNTSELFSLPRLDDDLFQKSDRNWSNKVRKKTKPVKQ